METSNFEDGEKDGPTILIICTYPFRNRRVGYVLNVLVVINALNL